jgi:hypothetical protein
MQLRGIPFEALAWDAIEPTKHVGLAGTASWRTRQLGDIRVRMVEYSPGYRADHWCSKGHLVLCVAGQFDSELADGRVICLNPGTSYFVADDVMAHRSSTVNGATLYIID